MKILCVPPKTLSQKQIAALKESHIFVIVTKEPEKVFFINDQNEKIKANDIGMAALKALSERGLSGSHEEFIKEFYQRLKKQEPA